MSHKKQEFRIWQTKLYNLQREAPKPHVVPCTRTIQTRPPQYGIEYHGSISRLETEKLLEDAPDGAYLIRDSQRAEGAYTLVIWFDKVAKNYMLHYDPVNKQHYVGGNRFDTIELLVADGLIHFYVETRGADVLQKIADANIYESTPFYRMRYHTFNSSTLDNALDQLLINPPSTDSRAEGVTSTADRCRRLERRIFPPTDHRLPDATAVTDTSNPAPLHNRGKHLLLRRQSIDAAQLSRQEVLFPVPRDSPSSDWPIVSDKCSDLNSEGWRYRVWPPKPEQDESRKFSTSGQTDLAPVPPPRRFSSTGTYQQPSSPSASLRLPSFTSTTVNDSRTTLSDRERRALYSRSQTARSSASKPVMGSASPATTTSKLSHIPEDSNLEPSAIPSSPNNNPPASPTNSRDLDSTSSFTSDSTNTTATSSSGYSDHPSPTDTSNSSSAIDGTVDLADSTVPVCLSPTASTAATTNRGVLRNSSLEPLRNGTRKPGDQTVITGKNAMLTLQERYNLPAACFADQIQSIEDSKPHNFKVHTFRGPHWCDYCTHFIWGLVAQGFKCMDCGFQAHKRCADRVPCDCLPDIKQLKRVFGVDLTSLTRAERKNVPTILVRCVEEIERRGALSYEGLYRIPGNHDRVEQIRASFDKDSESADISPTRIADVNVITSLIKSFLRQLPVPLITYDAYPDFIEIIRNDQMAEEKKLLAIRALLIRLPSAHYESLRYFMQHIHRVAQQKEANMMTAENLAIVLSPSLMTSSYSDPISCMVGTRSEHVLVERMIKDFDLLFPTTETPVRRVPASDARQLVPGVEESSSRSKRNSQIAPIPVSPSQSSSQMDFVKRKFLRNRRSVDTPLLAAATASNIHQTSNNKRSSPSSLSSVMTDPFSINTAL